MALPKPRKKKARMRHMTGIAGAPTEPGRAADWYFQYEVESKNIIQLVKSWVKASYDKKTASQILSHPDYRFNFSHWGCIIHTNDENRMPYLKKKLEELAKNPVAVVKEEKKESFQKIKKDPVNDWIADLEELVDDQTKIDFYSFAINKNINAGQAKRIIARYTPEYEELQEALLGKDPQLKEAYAHLTKKKLKDRIAFFKDLIEDFEKLVNNKKTVRAPRKPKVKSAAQLVKDIKYLKNSSEFKIESLNPEKILGASELWTYNTKYKKLTRFIAAEGGFSIKGTTLQNVDFEKSEKRTLRKPAEQLTELGKVGKVKLKRFMEQLTTRPKVPNGRINGDTLLVRAQ